jgi:ureidoglycolate lyase
MKAIEITAMDFSDYGIFYDMVNPENGSPNVIHSSGDGWKDGYTTFPVIDTLAHLGFTLGTGTPFTVEEMERHQHTQEALFCAGSPIVFCVAKASEETAPQSSEIKAVILQPGQVAVLHRSVWHSSAHGLKGETLYNWLALCYENEPSVWQKIIDGPITVEA